MQKSKISFVKKEKLQQTEKKEYGKKTLKKIKGMMGAPFFVLLCALGIFLPAFFGWDMRGLRLPGVLHMRALHAALLFFAAGCAALAFTLRARLIKRQNRKKRKREVTAFYAYAPGSERAPLPAPAKKKKIELTLPAAALLLALWAACLFFLRWLTPSFLLLLAACILYPCGAARLRPRQPAHTLFLPGFLLLLFWLALHYIAIMLN